MLILIVIGLFALCRTFYGYRNEDEMFLRIYFFNPRVTKKVAEMLGVWIVFRVVGGSE